MEELHETAIHAVTGKETVADRVTRVVGSMPFIIVLSLVIALWITFNVIAVAYRFDDYPFVFLNLLLGFMSAYTGPFVLMSQSKQEEKDRKLAQYDVEINRLAEQEMEVALGKLDETLAALKAFEKLPEEVEGLRLDIEQLHITVQTITHPRRHNV
jgi:uncharacterized membrane protein